MSEGCPRTVDELLDAWAEANVRRQEGRQWRLDLDVTARELAHVIEARIENDGWAWNPLLSLGLDACAILREIAAKPAPDEALVNARDASECIDHLRPSADGPERVEEHPA